MATVDSVNLFNHLGRVVISNLDPGSYWHARRRVDAPAHNPTPRAPEHLAMLNNLAGQRTKPAVGTHLPTDKRTWRRLSMHAQHVAAAPTRCCFQCGMLNYPKEGDEIVVQNVRKKVDCRAYRVFRYYIKKLIADKVARHSDNTTLCEAKQSVFLCKPQEGGGCRVYTCAACKKLCRQRNGQQTVYEQCSAAKLNLFDGHDADGTYASIGIGDKQAPEYAALTVNDRLALGVLHMADAVFKGYGGAGYTHSGGGGLLQPNDFHGMAALLVRSEDNDNACRDETETQKRRQDALKRLLDPVVGNSLVRNTLTCLEREVDGAFPTIAEADDDSGCEDGSMDDGRQMRAQMLRGSTFAGAATSMLSPGETTAAVHAASPTVGVTHLRRGNATHLQPSEGKSSRSNPDVATFTTLLPHRDGGFANTKTGCTRRHYVHKMFGSVATPFRRAEEFVWYHFQMGVKRALRAGGPRLVNPHVALNASKDDVDEHAAKLREQWEMLQRQEPDFVPYCNVRESFTGGVPKTVVGSKAYWCVAAHSLTLPRN